MNYPIEKYKFFVARKENGDPYGVIAVSSYAGRTVRGVARCNPGDAFDLEKGKKLAAARCNYKVAQKRLVRAGKMYIDSGHEAAQAALRHEKMKSYYTDSVDALDEAEAAIKDLLKDM